MDIKDEKDLLEQMIKCDPQCSDLSCRPTLDVSNRSEEWMMDHLPGYRYVLDRTINYMFSNNLTTGQENSDEKLNQWLYQTKNLRSVTNFSELRDAIAKAISYGECGIREYQKNIYTYTKGYYGTIIQNTEGIIEDVAYYVHRKGEKVNQKTDADAWSRFNSYDDVFKWFEQNDYILLSKDEFMPLLNKTAAADNSSPLYNDRLRVDLLLATYDQLNYDIRYDGPGRTFFLTDGGYVKGEDNDIDTTEVIANTPFAREEKLKSAKKEISDFLKEVKNSSSDSVGVLSGAFKDKFFHLPRVTKATEFLNWIQSQDTLIVAELIGMSPTLLEIGKLHGNISVQTIVDNAMLNTVIPMREMYATQFSQFISKIVGVPKIYFDKYDMKQIEDENSGRQKLSVVIRNLADAYQKGQSEDVGRLIDEISEFMRISLYDDYGAMKKG